MEGDKRSDGLDFVGVSVHFTFLQQEPKKLYVVLPKFQFVRTCFDIVIFEPLQDEVKTSSSSIVVRTTIAHIINKSAGLAMEAYFVQNFVSIMLKVWGAVTDTKRAMGPFIQPIRHGEGGFLDRRWVERNLSGIGLQIEVKKHGKLANGA